MKDLIANSSACIMDDELYRVLCTKYGINSAPKLISPSIYSIERITPSATRLG